MSNMMRIKIRNSNYKGINSFICLFKLRLKGIRNTRKNMLKI